MTQATLKQNDIEGYLSTIFDFRKNVVTNKTEYRSKETLYPFTPLEDYTLNSIRREAKRNGIEVSKSELSGLLNSNYVSRIDVIKEYFTSLKLSPGSTDYIALLTDTVQTTNQPLWTKCFKKWLVAAVACAVNPDKVNHQVLVLVGEQGLGKTSWLNRLLPPSLKGYMYAGHINPNNKDTLTTLTENLYVNLDELAAFRRNDIDNMKELITKHEIQFRRPYATYSENFIRRASFMGSVNHFHFLSDETGNRRFLPFTVTAIDYKHAIDMDEIYAQAYSLYQSDFKYWFDAQEILEIQENNEQYMEASIEQQLIEKWLKKADENETHFAATSTEIAQLFKDWGGLQVNNATVQRIGSALRLLGFKRVKRQGVYKYLLNKNFSETPDRNDS